MKKLLTLSVLFAVSILFYGCPGDTGPAGADGADGENVFIMNFQQGMYPTAAYAGNTDNTLTSGTPDTNRGTDTWLYVGYYYSSDWQVERTAMKFDIDGMLPSNATVTKAYLTLYMDGLEDISSIDTRCYKITTDWDVSTATWNSPWTTAGGDFSTAVSNNVVMTTADDDTFVTWILDAAEVQSWLDNPSGNYGFMLKSSSEDTGEPTFRSGDYSAVPERRPMLTVYYTVD